MQYFMYVLIYVSAYWVVKHAWCWMLFKGLCRDLRAKGQSTAQRQQEIIRAQTLWPGKDIWNTSLCRLVFFKYIYLFIFNILFFHHICAEMVFCYQNCYDLLWEKIILLIEKNFWNSRLKAVNLQKFWDRKIDLFKQWKVRTIFGYRMLF